MTIQGLFDILLPRMTEPARCSILEAVREVQGIVAARLLLKRSELIMKDPEAQLAFAQGVQSASLPSDYKTLAERPYELGTKPLSVLGNQETSSLQTESDPRYYRVIGKTLKIWPPPAAAITIRVPYFFIPTVLTDLADTLPFYGEFDSVFIEGCAGVLTQGLAVVADNAFVSVIQSQVDGVLLAKQLADEQLLADDINDL